MQQIIPSENETYVLFLSHIIYNIKAIGLKDQATKIPHLLIVLFGHLYQRYKSRIYGLRTCIYPNNPALYSTRSIVSFSPQ